MSHKYYMNDIILTFTMSQINWYNKVRAVMKSSVLYDFYYFDFTTNKID